MSKSEKFNVVAASKDELLAYAKEQFDKELNGRDKVDDLRQQVKELLADTLIDKAFPNMFPDKEPVNEPVQPVVGYSYCLNLNNGRILMASEGMRRLVDKGELVPCDKNGKRL